MMNGCRNHAPGASWAPEGASKISTALAAIAALALTACSTTTPPTLVTVTPEAPPPVLASECWRASPAAPRLAGGTARQIAWHLEAAKKDRAKLVAWRAVCRASLKAHFGEPAQSPAKGPGA